MKRTSFEDMNCSVAHCLEAIGEWWTPLIIRDLLMGVSRFDELHSRLGISRNVLTERLNRLVDLGVVEKVAYQQRPERYDYRLTEKGGDLWHVITAMREWGDRWEAPAGPPLHLLHRGCGEQVSLGLTCPECGDIEERRELRLVEGPGGGGAVLPVRIVRSD
ncbi:MAG: transcriptional regulator [Dehalococcoidia bacterium]|nr:transcriptional regulator [Dehalococcoidia bacterium]